MHRCTPHRYTAVAVFCHIQETNKSLPGRDCTVMTCVNALFPPIVLALGLYGHRYAERTSVVDKCHSNQRKPWLTTYRSIYPNAMNDKEHVHLRGGCNHHFGTLMNPAKPWQTIRRSRRNARRSWEQPLKLTIRTLCRIHLYGHAQLIWTRNICDTCFVSTVYMQGSPH